MKRNDSIYQLVISLAYLIIGILCFIPNIDFLQYLLFLASLIIILIGLILVIKGIIKHKHDHSKNGTLIIGLITTLIGISFSILVWFLFIIIDITFGIVFIGYGILGIIVSIRDKYGLLKNRILNSVKSLLYTSIGVMLIIDCNNSFPIIGYILGVIVCSLGLIGIINYAIYYKTRNDYIDAYHSEADESDTDKIIIDADEHIE